MFIYIYYKHLSKTFIRLQPCVNSDCPKTQSCCGYVCNRRPIPHGIAEPGKGKEKALPGNENIEATGQQVMSCPITCAGV